MDYYERPGDKIYPEGNIYQPRKQNPYGTIEYYFVKSSPNFPHFLVTISLYNIPETITTSIHTYKPIGHRETVLRIAEPEPKKEDDKTVYLLGVVPENYIKISFETENRSQYRQTNVYRARNKKFFLEKNLSDIAIIYVPLELIPIG